MTSLPPPRNASPLPGESSPSPVTAPDHPPDPTADPAPGPTAGPVSGSAPGTVGIIGGSVIGLSCAGALARRGHAVTVYSEPVDEAAAWVAGGMLGGITEAWPGEEDRAVVGRAALDAWERFLADPARAAPRADLVSGTGVVLLALDAADAEDVTRSVAAARAAGGSIDPWTRRELRAAEPSLARGVRCVHYCGEERAVDNRRFLYLLGEEAHRAGVLWRPGRVETLAEIAAIHDVVVLAAGVDAARLAAQAAVPTTIRAVRGEVVRLEYRPGAAEPPRHTIRARIHGRTIYLVPRADGLVVGATEYEHGQDRECTVGGVHQLLDDARRIFPGIDDYVFREVRAGLRPVTDDNLPLVGEVPYDGPARLILACGHGRHGILEAPLTAERVVSAVAEAPGDDDPVARSCAPLRWSS